MLLYSLWSFESVGFKCEINYASTKFENNQPYMLYYEVCRAVSTFENGENY